MSVVANQLQKYLQMDLDLIGIEAIMENKTAVVAINKEQMRMGKDAKGFISPPYRPSYLYFKKGLSTYFAGSHPDLFVTGDFQNGMFMRQSGKSVEIASTDNKESKLLEKYGEQIFEISEEFKPFVYEITTPSFYKKVHEQLSK